MGPYPLYTYTYLTAHIAPRTLLPPYSHLTPTLLPPYPRRARIRLGRRGRLGALVRAQGEHRLRVFGDGLCARAGNIRAEDPRRAPGSPLPDCHGMPSHATAASVGRTEHAHREPPSWSRAPAFPLPAVPAPPPQQQGLSISSTRSATRCRRRPWLRTRTRAVEKETASPRVLTLVIRAMFKPPVFGGRPKL